MHKFNLYSSLYFTLFLKAVYMLYCFIYCRVLFLSSYYAFQCADAIGCYNDEVIRKPNLEEQRKIKDYVRQFLGDDICKHGDQKIWLADECIRDLNLLPPLIFDCKSMDRKVKLKNTNPGSSTGAY